MKIILIKNEDGVFYEGRKAHINPQASKDYPVVDLDSLKQPELQPYQRYIALSTLVDGENEIELKLRKQSSQLNLTAEEQAEIEQLQARIDEIKANARKRAPKKTKLEDMSIEELEAYLADLKAMKENN